MNRLLVGIMLLAIVCIAGSCTDEDEYTQGQWMKKASYNGVYRAYASGFAIGNSGTVHPHSPHFSFRIFSTGEYLAAYFDHKIIDSLIEQ